MKSKMYFFKEVDSLVIFTDQNSAFAEKSKWSVWSIETFSTTGIWKFRIEKGTYGGNV